MIMNKRTFKGLAAVVALFSASMANAATVSLSTLTPTVNDGDSFTLDVSGTEFATGVSGFNISLTWDAAILQLVDPSLAALTASAASNGFEVAFTASTTPGQLHFVASTFSLTPPAGPALDLFSLDFTTLAPSPGTIVASALGTTGGEWTDALGAQILGIDYATAGTATVAVSAVPVPAAVWLFGSGLIGLAGIARRSNTKALG